MRDSSHLLQIEALGLVVVVAVAAVVAVKDFGVFVHSADVGAVAAAVGHSVDVAAADESMRLVPALSAPPSLLVSHLVCTLNHIAVPNRSNNSKIQAMISDIFTLLNGISFMHMKIFVHDFIFINNEKRIEVSSENILLPLAKKKRAKFLKNWPNFDKTCARLASNRNFSQT